MDRYARLFRKDPDGTVLAIETQGLFAFAILAFELARARKELRGRPTEAIQLHVVVKADEMQVWREDLPQSPFSPSIVARRVNASVEWSIRQGTRLDLNVWDTRPLQSFPEFERGAQALVETWLGLMASATAAEA